MIDRIRAILKMILLGLLTLGCVPSMLAAESTGFKTGEITTVALVAGVRLAPGETVELGRVATITGPLRESLQGLIVADSLDDLLGTASRGTLNIDRIRDLVLLHAAESEVTVRGTTCTLIAQQPRQPRAKRAPKPTVSTVRTVRDQIEAHLRGVFGVNAEALRLSFEDRDTDDLETPIEGRVVEMRVIGHGRRVPMGVLVLDGTTVVYEGTIRVGVELRREIAILVADQPRGTVLGPEHVRGETRWLQADDDSAGLDEAIGLVLRRRARTGETLTGSTLETPIAIHRGEIVMLRSVVGAASVMVRARALEDGRVGETIELERDVPGARRGDRPRVTAKVLGAGRAVIAARPGTAGGAG